jgi:filamentous hemagglutinin family protein
MWVKGAIMTSSFPNRREIPRMLAIAICTEMAIASMTECALAQSQIVPDNTLGNERSIVRQEKIKGIDSDAIAGGATRGTNLFHSFREFNVSQGRGAYFVNPTGVENILSRVTGDNVSQILGKLGVLGNANLFLMNPNGIIFGKNASLDVRGSFVATTANAIQFGDRGLFSATNPQSPSSLLTINPSAFFFNQIQAAQIPQIQNQSSLQVPNGQSLLLVGGNIFINGGKLFAPGGRVELAGIGGTGTVKLNINGNLLNLDVPESIAGANIFLTKGAEVNVFADGGSFGGDIAINAQNLTLNQKSIFSAGIDADLGSLFAQAGNIEIKAKENITLNNGSLISIFMLEKALVNGGNLEIFTDSLDLIDGSSIQNLNFGALFIGNAGNIQINATESVTVSSDSLVISGSDSGNTGNIVINAPNGTVSFDRGAEASTSVFSQNQFQQGGNITIKARNFSIRNNAVLNSSTSGTGNAGDIKILAADSVVVNSGGKFTTATFGQGKAGNVAILAGGTVSFDGVNIVDLNAIFPSGIETSVASSANLQGNARGGDITITARSLSLTNGAVITASTDSKGNAGNREHPNLAKRPREGTTIRES